jgi:energy-converting hydrogenase Eha subunit B
MFGLLLTALIWGLVAALVVYAFLSATSDPDRKRYAGLAGALVAVLYLASHLLR